MHQHIFIRVLHALYRNYEEYVEIFIFNRHGRFFWTFEGLISGIFPLRDCAVWMPAFILAVLKFKFAW